MKYLLLAFALALPLAACSRKGNISSVQTSIAVAADLGKTPEYFRNLYGSPKSRKEVPEFNFTLPRHGNFIRLARNFIVEDFESDRLKAKVVYSGPPERALWVKYTLPNPWTQQQINAALEAYGSKWKVAPENPAMDLIMQSKSPHVYVSGTSVVAYKTMVDELIVYAPQLCLDLRSQIQELDRQKKAVPKF